MRITKYVNSNLRDIVRVLIDILETDQEFDLDGFFPRDYLMRKPKECRNAVNELYEIICSKNIRDFITPKYEYLLYAILCWWEDCTDDGDDLQQWIYSMMRECEEFNDCIRNRDIANIQNTQLYGILKKRLSSVKADETAILFSVYPVVNDSQESVFLQFVTDFLQAVVNEMEENINDCRGVYFLYPSMKKGIMVLREANTRAREYINAPEIAEYISFDTVPMVEEINYE